VKVIKADEQRTSQRCLFDQRLDVLKQPEPLFQGRVQVTEGVACDEGLVAAEERIEQHVELDHSAMRLRHSTPNPEGTLGSH
jgi:hypothetical protein